MNIKNTAKALLCSLIVLVSFTSCSDDDMNANISINEGPENGDIGGDFNGGGGNASNTFEWPNNQSTAEYNADITTGATGSFNMVIKDADGVIVLDRGLTGGQEPDSFSGVTQSGTPGTWSVTISVQGFNGDGSFSISAGT